MEDYPDYVGAWKRASFCELPTRHNLKRVSENETSLFYIFIQETNGNRFKGVSKDYYGTAKISGTKSFRSIRFTKKYGKWAIGRKEKMTYRAVRTTLKNPEEELFAGLITSKNADPLPFIMKSLP